MLSASRYVLIREFCNLDSKIQYSRATRPEADERRHLDWQRSLRGDKGLQEEGLYLQFCLFSRRWYRSAQAGRNLGTGRTRARESEDPSASSFGAPSRTHQRALPRHTVRSFGDSAELAWETAQQHNPSTAITDTTGFGGP
nr:uncharacterized protein LOC109428548 [Aedes albopictus]